VKRFEAADPLRGGVVVVEEEWVMAEVEVEEK